MAPVAAAAGVRTGTARVSLITHVLGVALVLAAVAFVACVAYIRRSASVPGTANVVVARVRCAGMGWGVSEWACVLVARIGGA